MNPGHQSSTTCKLSEVAYEVHELADTFLRIEKLSRDDYVILTIQRSAIPKKEPDDGQS